MNGTHESVLRPFADAYNFYLEAVQETARDVQARSEEARLGYVALVHEVYTGAQQRAEEATQRYISAIKEAQSSEDPAQRTEELCREYREALNNAFSVDDSVKLFEAQRDLALSLQKAWDPQNMQNELEHAFSNYLRALQDAWAQTDADAVDSYSLATIGQSLLAASGQAASTLAQGGIRLESGSEFTAVETEDTRDQTPRANAASEAE
jgi:hypothetical protein